MGYSKQGDPISGHTWRIISFKTKCISINWDLLKFRSELLILDFSQDFEFMTCSSETEADSLQKPDEPSGYIEELRRLRYKNSGVADDKDNPSNASNTQILHCSQTVDNSQKHESLLTIMFMHTEISVLFSQQPNSNPFLNTKHFSEFTFVFKLLLTSLLICKETKAQMTHVSFPRTRTNMHAKFVIWT